VYEPRRLRRHAGRFAGAGDVHFVGGPRTIETVRAFGALDELWFEAKNSNYWQRESAERGSEPRGLVVLPLLLGDGLRLTPSLRRLSLPVVRVLRLEPSALGSIALGTRRAAVAAPPHPSPDRVSAFRVLLGRARLELEADERIVAYDRCVVPRFDDIGLTGGEVLLGSILVGYVHPP
jgi:hypothetical protein